MALTARRPAIDAARGVALVAMATYHACWDLTFTGLAAFDLLGDPLWLAARTLILSSFLLLGGISLVLATGDGVEPKRFLHRLGRLTAAAAVVSAMSYALFPDSPIFFGVLHHMAAASVIGLAFVRLPGLVTLAAALTAVLAGENLAFTAFDSPWLRWAGLTTIPPDSNDFVPLLPWIGGFLAGIALARLWPAIGGGRGGGGGSGGRTGDAIGRGLAWAGRHSLAFYLIHQPLLFGLFWLIAQGLAVEPPESRNFQASCASSCVQAGGASATCAANCRCVQGEMTRSGVWEAFLADRLDEPGRQGVATAVRACSGR